MTVNASANAGVFTEEDRAIVMAQKQRVIDERMKRMALEGMAARN